MKKNMNTDFSIKNVNEQVTLFGWTARTRNLGGLIFIDLRDRSGIMQVIAHPDCAFYEEASNLKKESVIEVTGIITERENKNPKLPTGDIELSLTKLNILNTSLELPFTIDNETTALEDLRLKYRYLDLRRESLSSKLVTRHKITMATRNFLDKENFLEIETPVLCKSTPEGARDYLVPSRVNKGKFYALPQSPQIFKQLLMVSGIEKYFQIAKCFRDEDLRADRQPEFTQIDIEMSFVNENDVMNTAERLIANIFKEVKGIEVKLPLLKMSYNDAINYYGSDKPDLRFDIKINELSHIFKQTEFGLFKNILDSNGIINGLIISSELSRKELDKLTEFVKIYKATGLFYLKFNEEITGSLAKNISSKEIEDLKNELNIKNGDMLLIIAGVKSIVKTALGTLRNKLGKELNLIDEKAYSLHWVTDFPSFEYSEEQNRFMATHHPFTAPKDEDIDKLLTDKANCYSKAYDMVINGYEASSGSIRIHNEEIQNKMFEALELSKDEIKDKFGFFVDALKYGTPPHGGIAFGLDRLTMLLSNTDNIRDVIAFPKTASASDLMSECPNTVDKMQLIELGIKLDK